ncbi:MAG: hypothetical protein V3S89_12760 [Desulfobacterales bacterium]
MENSIDTFRDSPVTRLFTVLALLGFGYFAYLIADDHPQIAWPAYLINLLLWSAIAQGGLLFSMVMHVTKARWSDNLSGLSHAFAAFFPVSFGLFLLLFLGQESIFPWIGVDLHGKEIWLNVPFLFSRDLIGLFVLYGLGGVYLYYALGLKLGKHPPRGKIRGYLHRQWARSLADVDRCRARMSVFGVLYMIAYAFVLSLIAFDLIMSADPHWISTLFGAYAFVKAFYVGLGALIILAAVVSLRHGDRSGLTASHFHDLGKLFFGFCLIWGDFFYAQFVVIWYGNLPEEASYVIQRTMLSPWKSLAWVVLGTCFIIPFLILLNRKVKTKPVFMAVLCSVVIIGIGLEHLLLLGPALSPDISGLSQGVATGVIFVGFFGLMGIALRFFLNLFPELVLAREQEIA